MVGGGDGRTMDGRLSTARRAQRGGVDVDFAQLAWDIRGHAQHLEEALGAGGLDRVVAEVQDFEMGKPTRLEHSGQRAGAPVGQCVLAQPERRQRRVRVRERPCQRHHARVANVVLTQD
ncbi:hypothetical protein H310_10117 [Aphanomyces invadans]|uniref:Uncharacterized protein n=1 Tax=Aphanomyces invadans TaxID=157072 RepID=A0A024TT69_9STRA|nr:hypothetical protein H310_10117 [Aphanomyces invadans]ETV96826.1 hypothetical protein H310_10117 [Aphanomyces invadans]|eukprot:XP_008874603.1 hypothetical protein H310_10117 [Aphanomyces invadans]